MTNQQLKDGASTPESYASSNDATQYHLEMTTNLFKPWIAANIAVLNWHASNFRSMSQAYQHWFEFVGDRLEKDAALAEELQTEKNPENVSKVYAKFFETAAKDYQEEASQLNKITSNITQNATDALQDLSAGKGS